MRSGLVRKAEAERKRIDVSSNSREKQFPLLGERVRVRAIHLFNE
jgi:hypothetical protein